MSAPGSLAYRKNMAAIWDGTVPYKYLRLLPFIGGKSILEIGAAEGVLALLLADRDPSARVTALELRHERCESALALQKHWRAKGRRVDGCTMLCGNIADYMDLLDGVETLVASRTIYYLGESIHDLFEVIGARVPNVVLAGNANRARMYAASVMEGLGPFNYYASVEGMREVLTRAGYIIGSVITDGGDPIVTGHR
jgi:hypothetical protein